MGGTDVVLGIEWLKSLGEVKMNWGQLTMKFRLQGEERCIQGDPTLAKTLVSLKAMMKNLKKGGEGYFVEFGEMEMTRKKRFPRRFNHY